MRPSFRNFLRSPCATVLTLGAGVAGSVVTFRFGAARDPGASTATAALGPFLESAGITALHLGLVDTAAKFPLQNAVPSEGAPGAVQCVLLVEGLDRPELEGAAPRIVDALESGLGARQAVTWEGYDLAFVIERSALRSPTTARQPPRPDLRERWK